MKKKFKCGTIALVQFNTKTDLELSLWVAEGNGHDVTDQFLVLNQRQNASQLIHRLNCDVITLHTALNRSNDTTWYPCLDSRRINTVAVQKITQKLQYKNKTGYI